VSNLLAKTETENELSAEKYEALLTKCQEIYDRGRVELIERYLELGDAINEVIPKGRQAIYGKAIILKLSKDMLVDARTIYYARQFALSSFRDFARRAKSLLNWSMIRMLLCFDTEAVLGKDFQGKQVSGTEILNKLLRRIKKDDLETEDALRDEIDAQKALIGIRRNTEADKYPRSYVPNHPILSKACMILKHSSPEDVATQIVDWFKDIPFERVKNKEQAREALHQLQEGALAVLADLAEAAQH